MVNYRLKTTDGQLMGQQEQAATVDQWNSHQAPENISLIPGKFQSQDTSTQMRIQLTRTASTPTLGDEIIRAANLVLLGSGNQWPRVMEHSLSSD